MLAHTQGHALSTTFALERCLDCYTDPSVTVGICIYPMVVLMYIFVSQMDLVQCDNTPCSSPEMSCIENLPASAGGLEFLVEGTVYTVCIYSPPEVH